MHLHFSPFFLLSGIFFHQPLEVRRPSDLAHVRLQGLSDGPTAAPKLWFLETVSSGPCVALGFCI